MKLSEKRRMAIYSAVHEPLMDARIQVRKIGLFLSPAKQEELDAILYRAQMRAAEAAVKAAEEAHKR